MEGFLHLFRTPLPPERSYDAWSRRSFKNLARNLSSLKDPRLYGHSDRYRRAVRDIARVLEEAPHPGVSVGLADYADKGLSPVKSRDLLYAAEHPELNIYYPFFSERLRLLFEERKPSAVGISLNYLSQALCAFSMAGFIRREFPGLQVIMGGGLITSWMKNLNGTNPFSGLVDHLVAGPGENRLLSLLGLDAAKEMTPCPDYGSLPLDQYLSPGVVLPYSASTGCYWNRCGFCPEKAEESPYIPIPVPQVSADLRDLAGNMRPSLIHLLDNAISPAHLNALCKDNPGVPWYGFARIDSHLADPDFCRQLKEAGCVMLKLGIESGDQEVLDRLEKGISLDTASAALKNLKKAGIAAYVYLLFGTPAETPHAARKTLEFTVQHQECIDFLNLAIFNMPVCSRSAAETGTREFYEGDLSLYTDFVHPQGWDRKRVRLFLDREFRRHPAVAAILRNEPFAFTSNHAPFFIMNRS
jgi:radical SAM superfamily enzyme YgiQ (UPF0313 family)